jgi:hypothetical protein
MDVGNISSSSTLSLFRSGRTNLTPEQMAQRIIEDKDKDGNGTLSAVELCISDDAFKKVDTDGNGQLTSEELIAGADEIRKALDPLAAPREPETTQKTLLDYIDEDKVDDARQTALDLLF